MIEIFRSKKEKEKREEQEKRERERKRGREIFMKKEERNFSITFSRSELHAETGN
jgi:hypothetical protein